MGTITYEIDSGINCPNTEGRPGTFERLTPRTAAQKAGELFFFTGKACIRGHLSKRYTRSGICLECAVELKQRKPTKGYPEYNKKYLRENRQRLNIMARERKYGVTEVEYQTCLAQQNNRCAICAKTLDLGRRTHLDHKDKRFRGILCSNCNVGLGNFQDSIEFLNNAINYLKGCSEWHQLPTR